MIIFSPGPANVSERTRRALLGPDINHRGPDFRELLNETRELLLKVCEGTRGYSAVIFTGSGTAAIQSSLMALKNKLEPLLVVSNGVYSERAYEIALLNGLKVHRLNFSINELIDVNTVSTALDKIKPKVTYFVHHETGTGILNPLKDLAKAASEKGSLVMVDAISSVAGERLNLRDWHIDLITGSANKCIRGIPGLSFVIASDEFIRLCSSEEGYYLSLLKHFDYERKGQTPFTPAVHTFYALREALRELMDEGVDKRILHYAKIANFLRNGLAGLGLELYLDKSLFSNTMTSVLLPKGITYEYLYQKCRKRGYEIYDAPSQLTGKVFRIGTVGLLSEENIQGFLAELEKLLVKRGHKL